MKRISMMLVVAMMLFSTVAFADGGADFKAKCAGCHGANGEGKGAAPKLAGKASGDVSDVIANGGKKAIHAKPISGLSADQAKGIGDFVAGLK